MFVPEMPAWLEAMFPAGMRRSMVDVGGVRMHVAEWGSGPTVVMLHGNPSWGFLWRKVVAQLADEGLRIVVPDLVGLGLSDKPRDAEAHSLAAHGTWFGRLLDEVAPGDVTLVAQDWGGPIALYAAADRMARVRGLVLGNTVVGPPRPGFKPTAFHRFARLPFVSDAMFKLAGFPQNVMTLAQGDKRSILGRAALGYMWPLRHVRDRTGPLALARMVPDSPDHPSIPALERCAQVFSSLDAPVSLVWGTRDPILGSVVSHLERLRPDARVTRTDAGHFLQEEVPGPFADAVRDVAGTRFN
ncbi:MAG TPA: alpha/beta fold hydrolase [Kofleriaceae bacterium]|nr:alpha/beta fold hydrolase [Kofleriaceae bacterium]